MGSTASRPSLLAYLHFNSNQKRMEHGEPHHDQPSQDPPKSDATLGNCATKPYIIHPDEDNGADVNRQTIDDERAGQQIQRAQRGGQYTSQPELSSQTMGVSKTETAVTEVATKRLEKGHAPGLSAPLSIDPAEIPRGVHLIEAIFPNDEDWVIVDDDNNPVSQIARSDCQHKLRNESQDAPSLGRTPSGAAAGEPQPGSFLLYIKELALAGFLTGCPNTIAQAHRAQRLSLSSKHVGSGGVHQGGTESCEVGPSIHFRQSNNFLELRLTGGGRVCRP